MAKLPDINSLGERPTPRGNTSIASYRDRTGEGLDALARGFSDVGETLQRMEDEDALVSANKTVADAGLKWTEYIENKRQTYDKPGAKGFTPSTLEEFDKFAAPTIEGVTNKRARDYVQQHLTGLRMSLGEQSIRHEVATRKQYNDQLNEEATASREKKLIIDPSAINYQSAVAGEEAAIDADPYTSPQAKIEKKRKAQERFAISALNLSILKNPDEMLGKFKQAMGIKTEGPAATKGAAINSDSPFSRAASEMRLNQAQLSVAQSIFQQESRSGAVDTSKPNYAGATGPMQVMPKTFAGLQKNGAIPADWSVDNPEQNTKAGLALIKVLGEKFGDDPRKIAAAYYSGEKAIKADGTISDFKDPKNPKAPTTLQYVDEVTGRLSKNDRMPVVATVASNGNVPLELPTVPGSKVATGDPRVDALSPEKLVQFYSHALTLSKQQQAIGKIQFEDRLKDSMARASNGVTDKDQIPDAEFVRYLGEERGPIAAREYKDSQVFAGDISRFSTMAPQEAMQMFTVRKPDAQAAGFAGDMERYTTMQRAWENVQKQREDDAGAYVLKHAPSVTTAFNRMNGAQTPEDRKAAAYEFASASFAEQQRLGIQKQALLPTQMADQIVAEFNRNMSNGDNMATRITAAEQQWGQYWPAIHKQLATQFKGQLPDSFLLIPGLQSQSIKEEVARLDHIKLEDLKKQVSTSDVKTVSEKIQEELRPWAETLSANKTNSDLYQSVMASAQKVALSRIARGDSISRAIEDSASVFIGHYEFTSNSSLYKYAVPKSENVELVTAGVQRVLNKIQFMNIGLPPLGDNTGHRKPEEVAEEWKRIVMANPIWMTNGNETGLKLYSIGKDGRPYPVYVPNEVASPDGKMKPKQIEYTWAELRSMVTDLPQTAITHNTDIREHQRTVAENKVRQRELDAERDRSMRTR